MLKLFHWPGKNLVKIIPIVLLVGFIVGYFVNTSVLKQLILPTTFLMIYPTMIGFKLKEAVDLSHGKVVVLSLILNFLVIPFLALGLGKLILQQEYQMLAGLVLASLLPTSGMTISWTMLFKGNVPGAIKITAIGLITGSLVTPLYLQAMVGAVVDVNLLATFKTIALVVFTPLILGNLTYKVIMTKMTPEEFKSKIKPALPSASVWAMLFIIFSSISMKAKVIIQQPKVIGIGLAVLITFYLLNFTISTFVGRIFLNPQDAVTLVFGTVMRNLSLALGLAVTTFGSKAALIVTLAFILQVQGAAWYGKLAEKYGFFKQNKSKQNLESIAT